jgi:hypothetical protein
MFCLSMLNKNTPSFVPWNAVSLSFCFLNISHWSSPCSIKCFHRSCHGKALISPPAITLGNVLIFYVLFHGMFSLNRLLFHKKLSLFKM